MPNGVFWPRGKVLGGSGSINAMVYVRGHDRDYDQWEEMGNPTWGFKNVLEYFKKSEKAQFVDDEYFKRKYHGVEGTLRTEPFFSLDPLKEVFEKAAEEIGLKRNYDINGDTIMGYNALMGTIGDGERSSPAKAFLNTIKDRKNLHIIKNAHVTKIEISDKNVVEGVSFKIGDKFLNAKTKKEVILSAGAVNTPQLLMLSGIGPEKHLKSMEIPVKKDIFVGHNLQDHAVVYIPLKFHKSTPYRVNDLDFIDDLYMYIMKRIGSFTNHGITDLTAFVNTVNETDKYPDIQYHFWQYRLGEEKKLQKFVDLQGFDESVKKSIMEAIEEENVVMAMVVLLNPKSKGKIELRSADPFDTPKIYANYLDEQDDVNTFIRGIRFLLKMIFTDSFKKNEGNLHKVEIPECDELPFDADVYWECYVRHLTTTVYHPAGTAKMGPDSDAKAVVDSRLKVKGVKGLRVIDASIMPNVISGNTNAPTIMIGEKGADFIKEDWQKIKDEL